MVLVDREVELKLLESAFGDCLAEKSGVVVVEAAFGCGKSEILEIFVEKLSGVGVIALRANAASMESVNQLGVVRQLLGSGRVPADSVNRFHELLKGAARAEAMEEFSAILQKLSAIAPVVIAVDDVQYADRDSLHFLLHAARRCRAARLMMIFTESLAGTLRDPVFSTELLRQPNLRRIQLSGLTRRGVGRILERDTSIPADSQVVDGFHAATGGNPLLVRALMEDYHALSCRERQEPPESPQPTAGGAFGRAILAYLYRDGAAALAVAQGLAVLGGADSSGILARLLGITSTAVDQGVRALNAAGIISGYSFRHPMARTAVLESMEESVRVELHLRAAALLYSESATTTTVAAHLRVADQVRHPWGIAVLRDAAEQALADGNVKCASSYLELAHAMSEDGRQRIEIKLRLADVMRRVNLSGVELHLRELMCALNRDLLSVSNLAPLAKLLCAHGWIDDAREVLDRLEQLTTAEIRAEAEVQFVRPWLTASIAPVRSVPAVQPALRPKAVSIHPKSSSGRLHGLGSAARWLPGRQRPDRIVQLEELLDSSPLTDSTLDPIVSSLRTLLHRGRIDMAGRWCDRFLKESAARNARGWEAVFSCVRAEISLHRGDLVGAEEFAVRSLHHISQKYGTSFSGAPIGILAMVYTNMGKYDEAARQLDRPVTDALFRSVHWLGYRRAHGRYFLATNRFDVALGQFLAVGRLAERWGVDDPAVTPWRADAAEALVALGDRDRADGLIAEHLAKTPHNARRSRGIALRLKASLAAVEDRPALLAQALDELQLSGDKLELARVLLELGSVHQSKGESGRASMLLRQAHHIAQECGARPLSEEAGAANGNRPGAEESRFEESAETVTPDSALSESELRVAWLAARGHTNREIADKLCITVSTVEQHLTRVYRKLDIAGRQELPTGIQMSGLQFAAAQ
ncbi:AAA family ATPase [Kitasatospora sp. NPDC056531]|uniref:helix-turn-helix transcriptional regulator n=1 Tax=Kitasatospora sp. NPDC056531 TaxID=3345856 RepID=UPI0036B7097B